MKNMIAHSVVLTILLGISGCNSADSKNPSNQSASAESSNNHGDHDHGDHDEMTDMEKMKFELAKLSPEDAASALKQHFCPVSGDMLGAMGPPIKVDVEGQTVWLCCEGCRDPLLKNPSEYLA